MNPYDLVHRYHDAFNQRDVPYDRLFAPNLVLSLNGTQMPPGLGPKRGFDKMWWDAIPDLVIENITNVTVGNVVLIENRGRGTQQYPLVMPDRTVPSLGKSVDIYYAAAFEIEGERIARQRMYMDRLSVLTQLGALP